MGNKKQGGTSNSNVDMRNGKLSLSIPLFSMNTPGGANYNLFLRYDSATLPNMYEVWNREMNTGLTGIGWGLNINDNIFAIMEGADIIYYMIFKGILYLLVYDTNATSQFEYKTSPVSNFKVYYSQNDDFILYDEYGIKYVFGRDDNYVGEKGVYSVATGDYESGTKEYENVRKQISNPGIDNLPAQRISDNTISSTKENVISWNEWVGPSYNMTGTNTKVMCWRLSHIIDAFSNMITFSYIQHISDLMPSEDSEQYCIASYLYRISLYLAEKEVEKIVFEYGNKGTEEYNVDFDLIQRPNGIQYKFQKLYITQLSHYLNNYVDKRYALNTEIIAVDDGLKEISKRQLMAIHTFGTEKNIQSEPGFSFEYYNTNDGVSIGKNGFSEKNRVYNPQNGAVYGLLKTVEYPSGKIERYKYREYAINSVPLDFEETVYNLKKSRQILTPYKFHLFLRLFNDNKYSIVVYTWSIFGWKKQELLIGETTESVFDSYNQESKIDFCENSIIVTSMDTLTISIYKLSTKVDGLWEKVILPIELRRNIFSVSLNSRRLLICTKVNDTFILYPFVKENENYKMVGSPVDVKQKVGVVALVSITCLQENWIIIAYYRDIHSTCPTGFKGGDLNFYRMDTRCFIIRNDGSTSDVLRPGYVPFAEILTDFTTPIPPLVAEPTEYAMCACVGGNIIDVKRIEKLGEVLYARLVVRNQVGFYGRNSPSPISFLKEMEAMEWGIALNYDKQNETFKLIGDSILRTVEDKDDKFYLADTEAVQLPVSAIPAGNGVTYTYNLEISERNIKKYNSAGTFEYVYDGSIVSSKKDYSISNYLCMFRDNFFEVFYTIISKGNTGTKIFKRTYKYFNQKDKLFYPIETGSIDVTTVTYNEQEYNILKYLGYAGISLSIILLPLGFTSVFSSIISILSIALMAGNTILQQFFDNSVKMTVDPNTSFYGERYIIDGTTVWFRENGQERLTTLGEGLVKADAIKGEILADTQEFGTIYNYIPFFTDANYAYYTPIKNATMCEPRGLNNWDEGITGIAMNPEIPSKIILYNGCYKYTFIDKKYNSTDKVVLNGQEICIDSIVKIFGEKKYTLYFTGSYYYILNESSNFIVPKQKITDGIIGSEFTHVDASLFVGWENEATVIYLFNDNEYELVKFEDDVFYVESRGLLSEWEYPCFFEKIDTAGYMGNNIFMVTRNEKYALIDTTKKSVKEVGLLRNYFRRETEKINTDLQFNYDALVMTMKKENGVLFTLKKYLNGSLQKSIRDYVVSIVSTYGNNDIKPDSEVFYEYDTFQASYIEEGKSVAYNSVKAYVNET